MVGRRVARMLLALVVFVVIILGVLIMVDGGGSPDLDDGVTDDGAGERSTIASTVSDDVSDPVIGLDEQIERALSDSASQRPCSTPDPAPPVTGTSTDYRLEPLGNFASPTWVAVHPTSGWSIVVEREGRIVDLDTGSVLLDLSGETRAEHDGGALTATFDPEGKLLYLYRSSNAEDGSQVVVVTAHRVDSSSRTIESDGVVVLSVPEPTPQHDGGGMAFGPDGMLWVSFGDGGGLGDPWPNGQDPATLLGTVVRIDPDPETASYAIPEDNPFVGDDTVLPEVWAFGLRNPWRMSFDSETGALFLVDVGQSCWEELNVVPDPLTTGGFNFGWDLYEGFEPFQTPPQKPEEEPELTDPWVVYAHAAGRCAAVGGYVYRGTALPGLAGAYLWSDFCGADVWAMRQDEAGAWSMIELGVDAPRPTAVVADSNGEPLVVSASADPEANAGGGVYRLVPAA